MTQKIIDWPKELRLGAQEWELLMPTVSTTSAFSGATFDTLIGPPRWAFSMDLSAAPAKMLPQIEATLRQLRNGLNLLGVSPFIQQVVIGVVIALAVTIDTLRRRSSTAR